MVTNCHYHSTHSETYCGQARGSRDITARDTFGDCSPITLNWLSFLIPGHFTRRSLGHSRRRVTFTLQWSHVCHDITDVYAQRAVYKEHPTCSRGHRSGASHVQRMLEMTQWWAAQHVQPWGGWGTDDHFGFHSCRPRSEVWTSVDTDSPTLETHCLVWCIWISAVIDPTCLASTARWWWWCHGLGNVFSTDLLVMVQMPQPVGALLVTLHGHSLPSPSGPDQS